MTQTRQENPDEPVEPVDPELAELTAYLDGELSEAELDAIERRLVSDGSLRHRLTSLDRTWQMLDALEDVPASDQFLRRTLDSIVIPAGAADGEPETHHPPTSDLMLLRSACAWLVLAFVCTGAGLRCGQWIALRYRDPQHVQLLENLDLLRRFPLYSSIPDVRFVRNLRLPPSSPAGSARTPSASPPEEGP